MHAIKWKILSTWTPKKKMILLSIPSLTSFAILSCFFALNQASFHEHQDANFVYKFRNAEAKNLFYKEKGRECIIKGPEIQKCGLNYLYKTDERAKYEICIKAIDLPGDFEKGMLALTKEDFRSDASFNSAHSAQIALYSKSFDAKFMDKPVDSSTGPNVLWLIMMVLGVAVVFIMVNGINFALKKKKAIATDADGDSV